jgi:hypothetical protein
VVSKRSREALTALKIAWRERLDNAEIILTPMGTMKGTKLLG